MFIGDLHLSRARGSKAQQRRNYQQQNISQENTIDFYTATKVRSRPIDLKPRTKAQEQLIQDLLDESLPIVIALGPAGTGKSYLAILAALRDLRAGQCDRLILTRPAVGVEDEQHGFLPGDLTSKMEPWTRPLLDIIKEFYHPKEVIRMIDEGIIEISPLAFMRGRTFKNSWIVADEMQNATPNQMKMLLTRIGAGSRIAVTGDVEQTDKKTIDNGLLDLASRLDQSHAKGISVCRLDNRDIQRHPIISSVLKMYGQ
jgi:phosphate starvation-inducible PhoH-like protein